MPSVAAARARAKRRFLAAWTQRADVDRPTGSPEDGTLDETTGSYTTPTSSVATGMACSLVSRSVGARDVDVAGDLQTQTRLEFRHDPSVRLQVDDQVTVTVHDDASLVGATFYVVGLGEAYEHIYGLAYVLRTEPDGGA